MTKEEFKRRWESDENGGGITYEIIATCYVKWGIGTNPKTKPIHTVRYLIVKATNTNNAENFKPKGY
jgi:hypothetical protein